MHFRKTMDSEMIGFLPLPPVAISVRSLLSESRCQMASSVSFQKIVSGPPLVGPRRIACSVSRMPLSRPTLAATPPRLVYVCCHLEYVERERLNAEPLEVVVETTTAKLVTARTSCVAAQKSLLICACWPLMNWSSWPLAYLYFVALSFARIFCFDMPTLPA